MLPRQGSEGVVLFDLLQVEKTEAIAEPVRARPGAQKKII